MKHATKETLADISSLLDELRKFEKLIERTPGSFYFKSKGFLHFHDDAAGIFADVKLDLVTFKRMRVSTQREQAALLAKVRKCLSTLGR